MMRTALALALSLVACTPDLSEVQKDAVAACTDILEDGLESGLASCRQDAWEACDDAYSGVLDDIRAELRQAREDQQNGCYEFLNEHQADWLHAHGCQWHGSPIGAWVCTGGPLCEVPPQ